MYDPGLSSAYFVKRERRRLFFLYFYLELKVGVKYLAWPKSETNRRTEQARQARNSKVQIKLIFTKRCTRGRRRDC